MGKIPDQVGLLGMGKIPDQVGLLGMGKVPGHPPQGVGLALPALPRGNAAKAEAIVGMLDGRHGTSVWRCHTFARVAETRV